MLDLNNNIGYMEDLFRKMRPLPPYEQRDFAECQDSFDEKITPKKARNSRMMLLF